MHVGHHLGSSGTEARSREFLSPMVDLIDRENTLRKYACSSSFSKTCNQRRSATIRGARLLIKLRNEKCPDEEPGKLAKRECGLSRRQAAEEQMIFRSDTRRGSSLRCAAMLLWTDQQNMARRHLMPRQFFVVPSNH